MAGVADVDPARDAVGGPRVTLRVPVSHGAALDRLAGLSVAVVRACGEVARAHVFAELAAVRSAWLGAGLPEPRTVPGWAELVELHSARWDAVAALREAEARGDLGAAFVEPARSVVAFVRDDPGASGGTDDAGPYGWIFTFERFDQGWKVSDVDPTDRTVELFTAAGYAPDADR